MLQCSLQFTSSVLLPVEAWTAQVTAPINSLEKLFHCLQISRHSFKHIQPKTKQHSSLSSLHLPSQLLNPSLANTAIHITVTCPLTKSKALLLQGLTTECQISASLAKHSKNEQQSYSKPRRRGDKLTRDIIPKDHLSALTIAKTFSRE